MSNAPDPRLIKRVRARDPVSSITAAERSLKFGDSQKDRIVRTLWILGNATAADIALITGLTVVQIDRRLPEAKEEGDAQVLQLNGEDVMRGDYRVWVPGKNFATASNKKARAQQ